MAFTIDLQVEGFREEVEIGSDWNRRIARPVVLSKDRRRLDPQMSKRKPAKASKRARSPAVAARAHARKRDIVKSAKDNLLRSASVSIDATPEWHDEPQEETRNVEKQVALNVEKQAAAKAESQEAPIAANLVQHGPGQIRGFGASAPGKMVNYQMMLLEMTQANMRFAFDFGRKLLTVRSAFQLVDLIVETAKRQADMVVKQSTELAARTRR